MMRFPPRFFQPAFAANGAPPASPLADPLRTWLRGEAGYRAALAKQQQTGQPLLVLFTAPWCGPCQRFKAERVTTPAFVQASAGYLKVVVDNPADVRDNALLQEFGGTHYPSLFVARAGGNRSEVGLFGPNGFLPVDSLGL